MATVLEACFRPLNVSASATGPPNVIIKISSKPIKVALLKNRQAIPKPADSKASKLYLVEDLTPATRKMLTAVSKAKDTSKAWTVEGKIKYTLEGQPTVFTVKSVYSSLDKVLGN